MRIIFKVIFVSLVMALVLSCHRRKLEEDYQTTAKIPVTIDWSQTQLRTGTPDLYSASMWVYPKDGDQSSMAPQVIYLSNPLSGSIELAVGKYSVIVFNNDVSSFTDAVAFRGMDKYETFEYYSLPDTKSSVDNMVRTPDMFAAWSLDDFEVTQDMITLTRTKSLTTRSISDSRYTKAEEEIAKLSNIVPRQLTYSMQALVHVKGLNNAKAPARGELTGMASGVFLVTGKTQQESIQHSFILNNVNWDDDEKKNGVIRASFQVFGSLNDETSTYHMRTQFTLISSYNGSTIFPTPPNPPFIHNVTAQVVNSVSYNINIEIGIATPGDSVIELPNVKFDGGFDIDIGGWDEQIYIPLN